MKTFEYFRPVRVDAMKAVRDLGYLVETRAFVSGSLGWNFSCNSVVLVGVISGGAGDLELKRNGISCECLFAGSD